jgi:hypothetical protein
MIERMRFQVPQFVDIEDRIIGPLTLKQFLIYLFAVMVCIPIYLIADLSLFLTLSLPILAVAAMFAHFKLYGKTLEQVIMNCVRFYTQGQVFIWRRTGTEKLITIRDPIWFEEVATSLPVRPTTSLNAMSQSLETQGKIVTQDAEDVMVK